MILYNFEEKLIEIPTGIAPNISYDDILNTQDLSRTLTENGSYSFGPDEDHNALAGVSINVDVHPITQRKVIDSSTAPQLVTPDEGAEALSEVLVNPYTINLGILTLDSSTRQQVVYPTEGIDGFNQVTIRPYRLYGDRIFNPDVISRTYQISAPYAGWNKITINAVGPWIDSNIQEQYIKKGVSILGVTGTLETDCPPCPDYVSQIKTINMGKVQQTVTPDASYDGLSKVIINPYQITNQVKTVDSSINDFTVTPDSSYDGLSKVIINGFADKLQSKTANSSKTAQVITPDSSYQGLSRVIINPYNINNQTKAITASKGTEVVVPDASYDGLGRVVIQPYQIKLQDKTVDTRIFEQVVIPDSSYDGLSRVIINAPKIESKTLYITQNGTYVTMPTLGYDGMGRVVANVNIPAPAYQTKYADSSTSIQYIRPDEGYDAISRMVINPYHLQAKSVTPAKQAIQVRPDGNCDGLSVVTVLGVEDHLAKIAVDSSTELQHFTANGVDCFGWEEITVHPYALQEKIVAPRKSTFSIYPSEGYDGLSKVTIVGYDNDLYSATVDSSVFDVTYYPEDFGNYPGFSDFTVKGYAPELKLVVGHADASTNRVVYYPTQLGDYNGFSRFEVNPMVREAITVSPEKRPRTYTPSRGYDGIYQVTVNGMRLSELTVDASTRTLQYTPGSDLDGFDSVVVHAVNASPLEKIITENGTHTINPPAGSFYSGAKITVDVECKSCNLWPLNIYGLSSAGVYYPQASFDGIEYAAVRSFGLAGTKEMSVDIRDSSVYTLDITPYLGNYTTGTDIFRKRLTIYASGGSGGVICYDSEGNVVSIEDHLACGYNINHTYYGTYVCCPVNIIPRYVGTYPWGITSDGRIDPRSSQYDPDYDPWTEYNDKCEPIYIFTANEPASECCGFNYYKTNDVTIKATHENVLAHGRGLSGELLYNFDDMTTVPEHLFEGYDSSVYGALPTQFPIDSLESVGGSAFRRCYFPSETRNINIEYYAGEFAFKDAVIGNGELVCTLTLIESVEDGAFDGSNLNIDIQTHYNLLKIGDFSFRGANIITEGITNTVLSVGAHAFENANFENSSYGSLIRTARTIGDYAFHGTQADSAVLLNLDIYTSVGTHAFEGTNGINVVYITNFANSTTVGEEAFYNIGTLRNVTVGSSSIVNKNVKFRGSGYDVSTGITLDISSDADLSDEMFAYSNVKYIRISYDVPYKCFDGCPIESLVISGNDIDLGESAFSFTGEENNGYAVNVNDSVSSIGSSCFRNTHLSSLRWTNNTITEVPVECFYEMKCSNVTWSDFSSTSKWGDLAFAGHHEFTRIEIPDGVEELGYRACSGSWGESDVEYVRIPRTLKTYGVFIGEMPNITRIDSYLTDPEYIGTGSIVSGTSGLPYDIKRNGVLHVRNISVNTGTQADPVMTPVIDIYRAQWFDDPDDVTKLAYYGWTIVNDLP